MKALKYVRSGIVALSLIGCAVTASAQGAKPAAVSEEDKAKAEAFAKERARVDELNNKVIAANQVVSRTFKAGNEALDAGRYDEAIAAYSEGIAAREDPALLTNRSEALRRRGITRFNAATRNGDAAAKQSGLDAAFKDWRDAAESARKAVALVETQAAAATHAPNKLAALGAHAEAMRLVASKVDRAQVDAATTAYREYIAATVDPAKKSKLQVDVAKMMFDAGAYDKAVEENRKILAADPNNVTAHFHLGFSLLSTGDKANFQEAANHLGAYVETAPETDPNKAEAVALLDFLKSTENITPKGVRRTGAVPR